MVIPFPDCIARPAEGGHPPQRLSDHLVHVADEWSARAAQPVSAMSCLHEVDERAKQRLCFLGGLLHDAGKARTSWQRYVRGDSGDHRGSVLHSPMGSALFFYASKRLVDQGLDGRHMPKTPSSLGVSILRTQISLDIAGHHGEIHDVEESPPWLHLFTLDQMDETDMNGLFRFVESMIDMPGMKLTVDDAASYISSKAEDEWRKAFLVAFPRLRQEIMISESRYSLAARGCLRVRTSDLITADRFNASSIEKSGLSADAALEAIGNINTFIEKRTAESIYRGASRRIVKMRNDAQIFAVSAYENRPNEGIYRINLPTGYGKTMAALRVALQACSHGLMSRIVYVAPYIAILSQATKDIREATGLDVIEHHHLSVLNAPDKSDDKYMLTMDSWQAPVVTTTFNQLFLALFPQRAQQTMRLSALRNAFIVVDEPQIIDAKVWKLFLLVIEALVMELGCQVLFTTATMPPTSGSLSKEPYSLTKKDVLCESRYEVVLQPDTLNAETLTDSVLSQISEHRHIAVILNTVGNAAKLFRQIDKGLGESKYHADCVKCYHLSGAMTSLHKASVIDEIHCALESRVPVVVVSTQVLEAGVDLSFDFIYREMPILPSVVQVAGRANRHGEKSSPAQVRLFRFLDENGREPRTFVYRSAVWREETDNVFLDKNNWKEDESGSILEGFFEACYDRSPGEALLEWLLDGAAGNGKSLRGVQPFEEQGMRIDVFVPRDNWISAPVRRFMRAFDVHSPAQVYNRYIDHDFLCRLSFIERRRFFALMQHFTVSVNCETARRVADWDGKSAVWILSKADVYDINTGLAGVGISDFMATEM